MPERDRGEPNPIWQLVSVGEDLGSYWDLGGEDEHEESLMDALVGIAEREADKQLGDEADYEQYNDMTLDMAKRAADALLDGPGYRHAGSLREPHLYPSRYAVATVGSRTVKLMQFERRSA